MKKRRLFGILFSLALMLGMMPVLGLSQTAYATGDDLYIGTQTVPINTSAEDLQMGWKYTPKSGDTPATLTLNSVTISEGQTFSDNKYGIFFEGTEPLKIVLVSGSSNRVGETTGDIKYPIYSNGDITIEGGGSITAESKSGDAIHSEVGSVSITGGTVTATVNNGDDGNDAIEADGNIVISGADTDVTAEIKCDNYAESCAGICSNDAKVEIDGASVNATVNNAYIDCDAIYADTDISVVEGTVTATVNGGFDECDAIYAGGNVNISGASKNVTATTDDRYAIRGKNIAIDNNAIVNASTTGSYMAILAQRKYGESDGGEISIDSSEVSAESEYDAIYGIDVTLKNSVITAKGEIRAIRADDILIEDSNMDDAEGQIFADNKLTIRNSLVKSEYYTDVIYGVNGVDIEYTKGGKYSTRVEATATGGAGPQGVSANKISGDIFAVMAKKDSLNIGDKLAITEPKGGKVANYKVDEDETIATVLDGNKSAGHVVIEVAKPAPAPTPEPDANPLTVTTTAKTTTRSTTIKWTWNAVDGAKKYKVAYHKVGSKKWKVKTTKKTKYVLKGQKIKGLYEYKVAAVTASGDVWSDTSCRYFKTVKAKAKSSKGALKVSWKKDKGASGYEIFIARNKKMDGAQVIQVPPTSKSYSVTGLEKGRYYVKVRPMKNYNGVTYTGILCKARKVRVK